MSAFAPLSPESATGRSKDLLERAVGPQGAIDPMVATMAHSPAVLEGYLELSKAMRRLKLDRRLAERIALAVQQRQGCQKCLAYHSGAAAQLGLDDAEIQRARMGRSEDPVANAVIAFALKVHAAPSSIRDQDSQELLGLGLSENEVADIVAVVALNVLTGSFNLATGVSRLAATPSEA